MSVAVEIARTLPCFDEGWSRTGIIMALTHELDRFSNGERAVLRFATAAAHLLANCDAETVDAALEALDRFRAGMVR